MKLDRVELLAALAAAAPALAKSSSVPGLDHFWFDKEFVYAYDGGLGVRVVLKSDLECGLPGKPLLDLLKTSALKEVSLEDGGDNVTLEMGKSETKLGALDLDRFGWQFPELSKKKAPAGLEGTLVLSEAVLGAITRVGFVRVVGKVEIPRTVHRGVLVHSARDSLEFYATDSASMVRTKVEEEPPKGLADFIAPWAFVDRFLELAEPGNWLYVLGDCLAVDGNGVRVYSNRLDLPEEPNVPKVMEAYLRGEDDKFAELPPGIQGTMERAIVLAKGDIEKALVKMSVDGKTLRVTGKYTLGSIDDEFTMKTSLPKASATHKASIVRRGLGQATGFSLLDDVFVIDDGEDICYVMSSVYERPEKKRGKGKAKEEAVGEDDQEDTRSARRREEDDGESTPPRRRARAEPEEEPGGSVRRRRAAPDPEPAPSRRARPRNSRDDNALDDEIPF